MFLTVSLAVKLNFPTDRAGQPEVVYARRRRRIRLKRTDVGVGTPLPSPSFVCGQRMAGCERRWRRRRRDQHQADPPPTIVEDAATSVSASPALEANCVYCPLTLNL